MRAVAYSIRSFEKEPLARANHKKHDITLISNPLGLETVEYAAGKEAVIISNDDYVSETIIARLADLGIKFITVRSMECDNIDKTAATRLNIKISTIPVPSGVPATGPEFVSYQYDIASGTIRNLDFWQETKSIAEALSDLNARNNNITPADIQKRPEAG